jgi:hypothetical protein
MWVLNLFVHVHFLHFGGLKMRYLPIVPFVVRKYIGKYLGCLEVSIRVAFTNIYKARISEGWLVQTCFRKYRPFNLNVRFTVKLILCIRILVLCFCSLRFLFYSTPNDKYKHAYSKTQSLRKRQFWTCLLMFIFCNWRAVNAISAHHSICR